MSDNKTVDLIEKKIQFQMSFPGQSNFTTIANSFHDWMKQEKIAGLKISPLDKNPGDKSQEEHTMGTQYLEVLNIVLSAAAVAAFVKGFWEWLKSRSPELEIKLKDGEKKLMLLTFKNFNIKQITSILELLKAYTEENKTED